MTIRHETLTPEQEAFLEKWTAFTDALPANFNQKVDGRISTLRARLAKTYATCLSVTGSVWVNSIFGDGFQCSSHGFWVGPGLIATTSHSLFRSPQVKVQGLIICVELLNPERLTIRLTPRDFDVYEVPGVDMGLLQIHKQLPEELQNMPCMTFGDLWPWHESSAEGNDLVNIFNVLALGEKDKPGYVIGRLVRRDEQADTYLKSKGFAGKAAYPSHIRYDVVEGIESDPGMSGLMVLSMDGLLVGMVAGSYADPEAPEKHLLCLSPARELFALIGRVTQKEVQHQEKGAVPAPGDAYMLHTVNKPPA